MLLKKIWIAIDQKLLIHDNNNKQKSPIRIDNYFCQKERILFTIKTNIADESFSIIFCIAQTANFCLHIG